MTFLGYLNHFMDIFTIFCILSGILVVTSTSTVYSVLWLVATFIIVSIELGLLNLGFPSLLYIIVYVGAIAILFLFVVQLLDLGNEDLVISKNSLKDNYNTLILAILFSLALSVLIVLSFTQNTNHLLDNLFYSIDLINYNKNTTLSLITSSKNTFSLLVAENGNSLQIISLGEWLYGPGLLPLIVVSVILLVAMIAPISLCKD